MGIEVELQLASITSGIPSRNDFIKWVGASMAESKVEDVEVVVRIVDETECATLNKNYRGKTGPTNVLSFPYESPPQLETGLLGDLIICAPVIEREAKDQGKPVDAHWAHMAVHGTLHLLGYDHQTDEQAVEMESQEKIILTGLGYDDPYRDDLD
ncbi:MAG TPA: rRNA maturation RNase YbeY [Gammaproteobacteria bacterium]|nr:rRNA maturation RNase YbeY [Gammaproteobacteria bacterium]